DEGHRERVGRRRAMPMHRTTRNVAGVAGGELTDGLTLNLQAAAARLGEYQLTGGMLVPRRVVGAGRENSAADGVAGRIERGGFADESSRLGRNAGLLRVTDLTDGTLEHDGHPDDRAGQEPDADCVRHDALSSILAKNLASLMLWCQTAV